MTQQATRAERDHAVTEVLMRYASGIDQRDWSLLASCFTTDCDADYGAVGAWQGAAALTSFMAEVHEPCGDTLHRITNVTITDSPTGVVARSYVDALVMFAGNTSGIRAMGRYEDDLVETEEGWKIARRRYTSVFHEPVGTQTPDG
jgi:3-phenylpropionate/cinnamic acid dioxygenase small subunit